MRQFARTIAALSLALLTTQVAAFAQAQSAPLNNLGPIRIGMTSAEVRAAIPDAHWTEQSLSRSGVRRQLNAPAALSIGGEPYDLQVTIDYASGFDILASKTAPAVGPAACEAQGLSAIAAIEPDFGALRQSVAGDFVRACLDSESLICASNVQTVTTNGGSTARRLSRDSRGRLFNPRSLDDRRIATHMLGAQGASDYAQHGPTLNLTARYEAGSCRVSILLSQLPNSDEEIIPPERLRLTRQATIGARHNAAIQLQPMPLGGIHFTFVCSARRDLGGAVYCNDLISPDATESVESIAMSVADQWALDLTGFDLEAPGWLEFEQEFTLSSTDIQQLSLSDQPIPLAQLVGSTRVRARSLRTEQLAESVVESDLLRRRVQFAVLCVVQSDLSLACALPDNAPDQRLTALALASASRIIAPATLTDGMSSVGRTIRVPVQVSVRDPETGEVESLGTD